MPHRHPDQIHEGLGRHRIGGQVTGLVGERRQHQGVEPPGLVDLAVEEGGDHGRHLPAHPVGGHTDHPDRPNGQQGQGETVIARVVLEFGLGHDLGRGPGTAGGVLDGHDVVDGGQAQQDLLGDLAPGSDRDVIEHHRQVGLGRRCPEVGLESGLGRAVVVGGDGQDAVGAGLVGHVCVLDGRTKVVAAGTGHECVVGYGLPDGDRQLPLLLVADGG